MSKVPVPVALMVTTNAYVPRPNDVSDKTSLLLYGVTVIAVGAGGRGVYGQGTGRPGRENVTLRGAGHGTPGMGRRRRGSA